MPICRKLGYITDDCMCVSRCTCACDFSDAGVVKWHNNRTCAAKGYNGAVGKCSRSMHLPTIDNIGEFPFVEGVSSRFRCRIIPPLAYHI